MKNIYGITLVMLLFIHKSFAQEIEHKEVWCNYWASNINGVYFVDHVLINSDTTFHSISYQKITIKTDIYKYAHLTTTHQDSLISSSVKFIGGYREDSGRVYVAARSFDTTMHEKLIYNYNLKKEDTAEVWVNLIGYQKFIVDSVFEMTIHDGSLKKVFTFSEIVNRTPLNVYWIEGLGSNFGLLNMHFVYIDDESRYLRCVKIDKEIVYDHLPVYNDDCLAEPAQNCDGPTAIKNSTGTPIEIYPNPANEQLILNGNKESFYYTIYDLFGREVLSSKIENGKTSIDVSSLIAGTYFIKIEQNGKFNTQKIVKI